MASRYITKLVACTAARAVGGESESEDEHSDEEEVKNKEGHAGSLAIIKNTLQGIAIRETNEGETGQRRHGTNIQLGRAQWETDALTAEQEQRVQEVSFDDLMSPDYICCRVLQKPRTKLQKQSSKAIQDLHHTRVQT